MKKIITLLFMLCSVFSFSDNASEKRIQVRGTATKEIAPNSAKIYLQITTQDENQARKMPTYWQNIKIY